MIVIVFVLRGSPWVVRCVSIMCHSVIRCQGGVCFWQRSGACTLAASSQGSWANIQLDVSHDDDSSEEETLFTDGERT